MVNATTDTVIIAIHTALLAVVLLAMLVSKIQNAEKALSYAYIQVCFCQAGWLLCIIAYRLAPTEEASLFLDNVPFLFIAFMPVVFLLMVLYFYHLNHFASPKVIGILCIIPSITGLIALFPALTPFLRTQHTMASLKPIHVAETLWGPWFYVHAVFTYGIMLACAVIVVVQHKKSPSGYALPSSLVLFGVTLVAAGNIINYFKFFVLPFDMTPVFGSVAIIMFSIAIANSPNTEYLAIARKNLFNFLDESVFMVDRQRDVIDINYSARSLLKEMGFKKQVPFLFTEILDVFEDNGGVISDSSIGKNLFIQRGGESVVYRFSERLVLDKKGRAMGFYASLLDITQYDKMIKQLEQTAEIDSLTGMANRRAFEEKRRSLDIAENLPFSIVIGDVNGLKTTNDTMGHGAGDILLQKAAKGIKSACPANGIAARIGGDEFVMLLPQCTKEQAEAVVKEIEEIFAKGKGSDIVPSVAFGIETKTDMEQSVDLLIQMADQKMYQSKKYDRRGTARTR